MSLILQPLRTLAMAFLLMTLPALEGMDLQRQDGGADLSIKQQPPL